MSLTMTCSVLWSAMRRASSGWASEGSVRREQNRRNWTSERGWRGSVPLFMFTVQALEPQRQQPAAAALFCLDHLCSSLPRPAGRLSVCVCVILLVHLCMCESLMSTKIHAEKDTSAALQCAHQQAAHSRNLDSHIVSIFVFYFPVPLDTLEWWQFVKVHWSCAKSSVLHSVTSQQARVPGEGTALVVAQLLSDGANVREISIRWIFCMPNLSYCNVMLPLRLNKLS